MVLYKFEMYDISHMVIWVHIFEKNFRDFSLRFLIIFESDSDVEGVFRRINAINLLKSAFIYRFCRPTLCYEPRIYWKSRAGKSRASFTLVSKHTSSP